MASATSKPLKLRYSFPSDQYAGEGPRIFELLNTMWKAVGVEMTVQALDADALTAICCPAFDYDVIQWGWGAGADPASLLYVMTTEQIPTGVSESGYSNPEYDQLFQEQLITPDKAKRKELLFKMQEIAMRDVPYILPYYPQTAEAYRQDRFQGWVVDPEGLLALGSRISLTVVGPVQ
jgi:peptide/nickel transport system substrate-binding protein